METISSITQRLLEITFLPGIGTGATRKILTAAYRMKANSLPSNEEIIQHYSRPTRSSAKSLRSSASKIIDDCANLNIRVISALDSDYPAPLRFIDDFPPILYVRGSMQALQKVGCAVVGTRDASRLGISWARQIAETFVIHDCSVVSGLALGIDTAAHEGALRKQGVTVAVMAHGLDHISPPRNKPLATKILDAEGALVAEHPPGTLPHKAEYVRRNRIQSGMSVCSVVVESGEVGGAIHQGNFTTRQGRRLYCVLPPPSTEGASEFRPQGAERLMKEANARPITSRNDLMELIDSGELHRLFDELKHKTPFSGGLI